MKIIKLLIISLAAIGSFAFSQVNINTASAEELSALYGIGDKKAEAIIKYRKKNGDFKSVKDLTNVDGVGEKIIENLGGDIKVSGKTDTTQLKAKGKSSSTKKLTTKKKTTKDTDTKSESTSSKKKADTSKTKKTATTKASTKSDDKKTTKKKKKKKTDDSSED